VTLKNKVLTGLKWSLIAKLLTQIVSWVATFYVIRLLTPEDYGVIAIYSIFYSFITIFAVNGFLSSLIKTQKKSPEISSVIFTLSLGVYFVFSLILIFTAEYIGEFYNDYNIAAVLTISAIFFPLNSLNLIPNAYMAIDMNFKLKGINESVAGLISAVVTITLAIKGFEYWSIIYGNLVNIVIQILLNNIMLKCHYGLSIKFLNAIDVMRFASKLQLNGFIWFIYNKIDSLILGRAFDMKSLGLYNVALEIANIPMDKVSEILNQVGFSAFSSISDNKSSSDYYLEKAIKVLSLIIFPVFFGISAVAEDLIVVLLTDKWIDAAIITAILALVCPFKMMNNIIQSYSKSLGNASFVLRNTTVTAVLTLLAVLIGVQFGLVETAISIAISFMLSFTYVLFRVNNIFNIKYKILFVWFVPCLISIGMWGVLKFLDWYIEEEDINPLLTLTLKILMGMIFIAGIYYKFYLSEIKKLLAKNKK
jgi:teichuronic acid exporter